MSFQEIKLLLSAHFGEDLILGEETSGLQPALLINPKQIAGVCLFLRDHPKTYFDFLACLTGVDYHQENRFGVVYHLSSHPFQTQLTLKISLEKPADADQLPSFPTLVNVYRTADWHEREAYDLLGIDFEGHPDLRRILLPDDWEGFPLRTDYKSAEYYKGIKID
ncbi:MAG: NADH-quinone oxidoreductase subunit C [Sphingobacteriaceae bacterium]|nr:MAG: NADH-quinone oxidoreductase subunit C [Sphingobacteriaceae bacterium]